MAADRAEHDIASLECYFKCAHANDESVTLCKAYRAGALVSNSIKVPRPAKIPLGSVKEKQRLLSWRKIRQLVWENENSNLLNST